jgi:DNA modification methylase
MVETHGNASLLILLKNYFIFMHINQLILGDNLEILKKLDSETVDLIYLDPPFFSNRNYEVIWGDSGEVRSFQDRWAGVSVIILIG